MKASPTPQLDDKASILQAFEALQKTASAAQHPSWLESLRKNAASCFAELNFPTLRDEAWKYTNVEPLIKNSFSFTFEPETEGLVRESIEALLWGEPEWTRLVFVNGIYSKELSKISKKAEGVRIESLRETFLKHPEELERYLARQADFKNNPFTALNTAFLSDGAFIFIPHGKVLEEPIHLLFISLSPGKKTISQPRNLIVLGEASQVKIIESHVSSAQDIYFTNAVTEIVLGPAASLDHYKVQRESKKAFHMATTQTSCDRSSAYHSYSFTFGAGLSRENLNVALLAEGGSCQLDGLYLVSDIQHTDHHTVIDHTQPQGMSRQLYKGILGGRAKAVFNGKIYVRLGAQKTDAHQINKNLLLTMGATVDTEPQLEIFADDVKCTHGAAVGELEEAEIFYVRSRGISEENARNLLTYGFASEVVNAVKIEPIRSALDEWVRQALQKETHAKRAA